MTEATGPGSGPELDANEIYALGSSGAESARLQRQAEELAPQSAALLDRVRLTRGHHAIDVGCGPRGVIELLATRVLPGGRVVGIDADPNHVAMARELTTRLRLSDTEILLADARHTGLPSGTFDVVHARTMLITVPEPEVVLAEMVRLTRPGGWVVGLEPDTGPMICYPPHPAVDRLRELFSTAFARNGADPCIGRRVPELYRRAGLAEIGVEAVAALYAVGHSRRSIRADLVRSMRTQIVAMGLSDEAELEQIDAAARAHFADPEVLVMPSLNFLIWGRRPAVA